MKLTFAPLKQKAEVAQLVEHNLAKVGVASPSLVFRSKKVQSFKFYVNFIALNF